jgi:hypothetical protein
MAKETNKMNDSLFAINVTMQNLNIYIIGEKLVLGLLIMACLMILMEIIDLPLSGKLAVLLLTAFGVMAFMGLPPWLIGIILVLMGASYASIFHKMFSRY